ncbi:MAG: GAF domain-containing protein [Anaerolineae bacterium]|nr:GAF domain-containing protein [Anaerolineae bacterium]
MASDSTTRLLVAGIPEEALIPALRLAGNHRCHVLIAETPAHISQALAQQQADLVVLGLPASSREPWEELVARIQADGSTRLIVVRDSQQAAVHWAKADHEATPSAGEDLASLINVALDRPRDRADPETDDPARQGCLTQDAATSSVQALVEGLARLVQSLDPAGNLVRYSESVADGLRLLLDLEAVEISLLAPPVLVRSPRQAPLPTAAASSRDLAAKAVTVVERPLAGGRHLVALPLCTPRHTYGTLTLLSSQPAVTQRAVLPALSLLTASVAGELELMRLSLEHNRNLDELQAISETGRTMVALLSLDQVLEMIVHTALRYVPSAGAAVLHVPNDTRDTFVPRATAGPTHLIQAATRQFSVDLPERLRGQHQPLRIPYAPMESGEESGAAARGSMVVVPLMIGQALVGALSVVSTRSNAFTSRDERILVSLASQGAVAIENARLHGQARKADEIAALYELSQALNSNLDLRDTVTTILSSARSLTLASSAEVRLASPAGDSLEAVIALGERPQSEPGDRYRMSVLYPRLVMESRRPLLIEDTHRFEHDDDFCRHEDPSWLRSYLGIPLITSQRAVGVLSLGSTREGAFTAEDVRLLEIVAGQAATALSNARLYEEATQRLREAEAIARVSRSVAASLDQRTVLEAVVSTLVATIPLARHAFAYLVGPDGSPSLAAQSPPRQDEEVSPDLGIWQWCADGCLVRGQPVHLDDTLRHGFPSTGSTVAHSVVAVPMVAAGKAVGVLGTDSTLPNAFTTGDLRLIKTFADQAATAIESARLFDDLNRAYRELSQSTETLSAVFHGITDGMYIVDREDRLVVINEPEARFLGSHPESLVGSSYRSLYHRTDSPCEHCAVEEALGSGEHVSMLACYSDRGERTVWREVDIYPIRDREGVTSRAVVFARDVTEKRRLEASLVESGRMASIGQLASSIAHEVNNPLTVIIGNAEVLLLDAPAEDPATETISMILRAARRAARTVQNLLDLSGQQEFEFADVDLRRTIEEALDLVTHPLRKAGIQPILDVADDLPVVTGSAGHLKVVWMNILLNARDAILAAERSDGEVRIEVGTSSEAAVYVSIMDNGVGMAEEQRERLFQPFFTTKPAGQGLGLGLYHAYMIVRRHGGRIEVTTRPGEGSAFTVYLPLDASSGEDLLDKP